MLLTAPWVHRDEEKEMAPGIEGMPDFLPALKIPQGPTDKREHLPELGLVRTGGCLQLRGEHDSDGIVAVGQWDGHSQHPACEHHCCLP